MASSSAVLGAGFLALLLWGVARTAVAEPCAVEICPDAVVDDSALLSTEALLKTRARVSPSTECTRRTEEFAIQLCTDQFADRAQGIASFRQMLEDAEDDLKWFQHKKADGTEYNQIAEYLNLAPGNVANDDLMGKHHLQFRHRRQISGEKVGKTDFVVKFKTGKLRNPINELAPMTASSAWQDDWSCKVEDNVKYVACPAAQCFPQEECFTPCPDQAGQPGVGLETQEQAPKIKGDPGSSFATQYPSVSTFKTLADVTALLPDISTAFNLGAESTPLEVTTTQWRYVYDEVMLEINGHSVESGFTLWYASEADLKSGTATPTKGEWSYKLEKGEDNWDDQAQADELLQYIGKQYGLCQA